MKKGRIIECDICGAELICSNCGGNYFIRMNGYNACASCFNYTGNYMDHDWDLHEIECPICNRVIKCDFYDHLLTHKMTFDEWSFWCEWYEKKRFEN